MVWLKCTIVGRLDDLFRRKLAPKHSADA